MGENNATRIQIPREQIRSARIETHFLPNPADDLKDLDTPEEFDKRPCLQSGTAFYYRVDQHLFLVTARHLVTNRNQRTGDYLGRYECSPTHIKIIVRHAPSPGGWPLGEPAAAAYFLLPLFDPNGAPRWSESPTYGAKMDAVVIPLTIEESTYAVDAYQLNHGREIFGSKLWVAQDVFIVGYPDGLESGFMMPLWIRGTIASEPTLFYPYKGEVLPLFLVDARTRGGQSGSPVILFAHPNTPVVGEDGQFRRTIGTNSAILGVYSGRTSDQSDLGFVWRIEEVDRICRELIAG